MTLFSIICACIFVIAMIMLLQVAVAPYKVKPVPPKYYIRRQQHRNEHINILIDDDDVFKIK